MFLFFKNTKSHMLGELKTQLILHGHVMAPKTFTMEIYNVRFPIILFKIVSYHDSLMTGSIPMDPNYSIIKGLQ